MIPNQSPWITQLRRTRQVVPLQQDLTTDVVIVGGGIAGVTTAFFTLRDTKHRVVLLEADKIAHGATGHNAGQITSYFERSFASLVEEFGLQLAADGQKSVEDAWILLDEIVAQAKLQTPLYRFTGYAGLSSKQNVLDFLEDNRLRVLGGLPPETINLSQEWEPRQDIPKKYKDLYTTIDQRDLNSLLETDNRGYVASLSYQKGCMNSALFSEELIGYLVATYPDRFTMYEGSPVKTVRLGKKDIAISSLGHTVTGKRAVLCTNGFENFSIINDAGDDINTEFHHTVNGRIGYMTGYVEPLNSPPVAISYYPPDSQTTNDPTGESYFYLTRRPHEHDGKKSYNLVCAGGPDKVLPNDAIYMREDSCSEEMRTTIDDFLRANYQKHPGEKTEYSFCWHGLMGYTPNRLRRIGPEPCNPVLLYNLGCNGVGILPSIYGGKRISQFLNEEKLSHSIFDPEDHRSSMKNPFSL